jgi:hypothetical protein
VPCRRLETDPSARESEQPPANAHPHSRDLERQSNPSGPTGPQKALELDHVALTCTARNSKPRDGARAEASFCSVEPRRTSTPSKHARCRMLASSGRRRRCLAAHRPPLGSHPQRLNDRDPGRRVSVKSARSDRSRAHFVQSPSVSAVAIRFPDPPSLRPLGLASGGSLAERSTVTARSINPWPPGGIHSGGRIAVWLASWALWDPSCQTSDVIVEPPSGSPGAGSGR